MGSSDDQYRTGELTTPMGTAAKFFADAITGKSDAARDYARHLVRPCLLLQQVGGRFPLKYTNLILIIVVRPVTSNISLRI